MQHDKSMNIKLYGTVTVGERGQVVIPVEARREIGLKHNDKLLAMGNSTHDGIMFCKVSAMQEMVTKMRRTFGEIEKAVDE